MRLGLIEAIYVEGQQEVTKAGIRGACASASLKRGLRYRGIYLPRRYPRRMRLGLIEASHLLSGNYQKPPSIRGACASASLKLIGEILSKLPAEEVSEAHAPRPH